LYKRFANFLFTIFAVCANSKFQVVRAAVDKTLPNSYATKLTSQKA